MVDRVREVKKNMTPNEEKITKGEIVKMVLSAVGLAGVLVVGITAPGLLKLIPLPNRRRYSGPSIKQAIVRLDKKGWIIARETGEGWRISLSKKGRIELLAYELGQKKIQKPRRWDRKWRLLMFDIPEKRKFIREKVRKFLSSVGFYRLQDSVWVFPYECQEIFDLLRTKFDVRSEALYLRAEFLNNDRWLQKHFELK